MAKSEDFNLKTVLSLQTEDFQKGVAAANQQAAQMRRNFKKHNDAIKIDFASLAKSFAGPLLALGSVSSIISFGKTAADAAEKAEIANRRLLLALNGNTAAYNELTGYANQLRLETGISGPAIKQIEMLGAGAGYSTEKIKKLVRGSIELSSVTGKDLQSSYLLLNKTLTGTVAKGLSGLDPAFKKMTKSQLENGSAIDLIISKYTGLAAISATAEQKLSSDWTKFTIEFGSHLEGAKDTMLTFVDSIVRGITPTKDIAKEMETERQKVNGLVMALKDHNLPLETRRTLLLELNKIAPSVAKGIDAEKMAYGQLTNQLFEYNKQAVNSILLQRESAKLQESANRGADLQTELAAKETQLTDVVNKYLLGDTRLKKEIKDQLTAQYDKDGNLANYATGLSRAIQAEIKKNSKEGSKGDTFGSGILNQIEILKRAITANSRLNAVWQDANNAFAKKNGLNIAPKEVGSGSGSGGAGSDPKVTTIKEINDLLLKIQKDYNDKFRKDDIQAKRDELELLYNTEKEKILSFKATTKAQKDIQDQALRDLENSTNRQRVGLSISPMIAKEATGVTTTGKPGGTGLVPQITEATVAAKKFGETMSGIGKITNDQLGSVADTMGGMAGLFGEQTAAYKAFATGQVILSTIVNANAAAAAMAWVPLGIGSAAAMALSYAIGAAQIAKINGLTFEQGGIVPGTQYHGDRVHAYVNSGEMILNSGQQRHLFSMLNSSGNSDGSGPGGQVEFKIKGTELVGVLKNQGRKISKIG